MTDLELLELAAKAAGIDGWWSANDFCYGYKGNKNIPTPWNPLTDDGDALRLAVKLNISVFFRPNFVHAEIATSAHEGLVLQEPPTPDKNAATRRAIVRAAAQIGANHDN